MADVERGYQVTPTLGRFWSVPENYEESPDLQWPHNIAVYDRMRRQDSQIRSVIRAVVMPILRSPWAIDPTGSPDHVAEFVARNLGLPIRGQEDQPLTLLRRRGRFSWPTHLRHALLMLVHGHSYFETVHRFDERAGLWGLRKLAWRPPRTISKIEVAADGGLVAIEQQASPYGSRVARIGVRDLVAYVHEREGGDWLGQSLLRSAYKPWLLKDRALMSQSISNDRNGSGLPVYYGAPVPDGYSQEKGEQFQRDQLATGLDLARRIRSGDTAGASAPHGAKIALQGVEGTLPNIDPEIRYHDEQIARAVLAHFLNLGTETGSWALGKTFADFFTMSLQAVADDVADVTNLHVIEDLVDVNFGEDVPAPRVVCREIGSDLAVKELVDLIKCGAVRVDNRLESYIRDGLGLPGADEATTRDLPASPAAGGSVKEDA